MSFLDKGKHLVSSFNPLIDSFVIILELLSKSFFFHKDLLFSLGKFLGSNFSPSSHRSTDFKPTNGVTTEVAVLKGMLFEDNNWITKKILAEADKRKLSKPNAELACLIREKFTDKEIEAMGLIWIVAMHEPINDFDGFPFLLFVSRYDDGRRLLAYNGRPDNGWSRDDGFAFAVS